MNTISQHNTRMSVSRVMKSHLKTASFTSNAVEGVANGTGVQWRAIVLAEHQIRLFER